jgi:hypothetical protein
MRTKKPAWRSSSSYNFVLGGASAYPHTFATFTLLCRRHITEFSIKQPMNPHLLYAARGAEIRFNRPHRLNAVSEELYREPPMRSLPPNAS